MNNFWSLKCSELQGFHFDGNFRDLWIFSDEVEFLMEMKNSMEISALTH